MLYLSLPWFTPAIPHFSPLNQLHPIRCKALVRRPTQGINLHMEPGCQGSQWPESGWNLWFKIGKKSSKLSLKLKHRNCLWFFWEKISKPMVYRCVSSFFGWKLPSNGAYRIPNLSDKPIDDRCNTEMEECRNWRFCGYPKQAQTLTTWSSLFNLIFPIEVIIRPAHCRHL